MTWRMSLAAFLIGMACGCGDSAEKPSAAPTGDGITTPDSRGEKATEAGVHPTGGAASTRTLAEAIDSGIALLEAEKYDDFVESFYVPEDLAAVKKSGKYDDVLGNFRRSNAKELLGALKSIQGAEPELSEDGKIAWFATTESVASQNKLAFIQVDGAWYIPNRPPNR